MKKVVCMMAVLALVTLAGCATQAPEDAAKAIVEKQIATKHQGFIFDTSDLDYEVAEEGDDFARVVVSGEIEVSGEIALIKKGGKWVIGGRPAPAPKAEAPVEKKKTAGPPAVEKIEKTEAAAGN